MLAYIKKNTYIYYALLVCIIFLFLVNITFADQDEAVYSAEFIEYPSGEASGNIKLRIQTSEKAQYLNLYITGNGASFAETISTSTDNIFEYIWVTDDYVNGNYAINAKVMFLNQGLVDASPGLINFVLNNNKESTENTTALDIELINQNLVFSGIAVLQAQTNIAADVEFYIYKNQILVEHIYAVDMGSNIYQGSWDATDLENGNYIIKIQVEQSGYETAHKSINIEVNNSQTDYKSDIEIGSSTQIISTSTNEEKFNKIASGQDAGISPFDFIKASSSTEDQLAYQIFFEDLPQPPLAGLIQFNIKSNLAVESVVIEISGEQSEIFPATKREDSMFIADWQTDDFEDGDYLVKALAFKNDENVAEKSFKAQVKNTKEEAVIKNDNEIVDLDSDEPAIIPSECLDLNLKTLESCSEFLKLPLVCREEGITNSGDCSKYLSIAEECRSVGINENEKCNQELMRINFPKICRDQGVYDIVKCQLVNLESKMPEICVSAGAPNENRCNSIIISQPETIKADKYFNLSKNIDKNCIEKSIFTEEACKKYLLLESEDDKLSISDSLPMDCAINKIESQDKCGEYLRLKNLPEECRQNKLFSIEECNDFLFAQNGAAECRERGLDVNAGCQYYLLNYYTNSAICENINSWQCYNAVKNRFIGTIVAEQAQYRIIEKAMIESAINNLNLIDVIANNEKIFNIIPVKEKAGLAIKSASESIIINANDELIFAPAFIFVFDNDADGLPNEIENLLGINPELADSDRDGVDDFKEIKNGTNPSGVGLLSTSTFSNIEKAILSQAEFKHPKAEGVEKEEYAISGIISFNAKEAPGDEGFNDYKISGKGEADKVLSLYIYSGIPIVAAVKTDNFGNWSYDLKNLLNDGYHEAYIVENDDNGGIINKSKSYNFIVQGTEALNIEDYVAPVYVAPETNISRSEDMLDYYLFISFLVLLSILIIFLGFYVIFKKNQES